MKTSTTILQKKITKIPPCLLLEYYVYYYILLHLRKKKNYLKIFIIYTLLMNDHSTIFLFVLEKHSGLKPEIKCNLESKTKSQFVSKY